MTVKKAIIPVGGLGTRFLPLSKVVPKELWPLVDEPVIQRIIAEAKDSGIEEITFVLSPGNKKILDYLKPSPEIEKVLKKRKGKKLLDEYKKFKDLFSNITFNSVIQKKPSGDGHAILQAVKHMNGEPVVCLFADDIVETKIPCPMQIMKVFKTCQKPVVALYRLPREKLPSYGIVKVEKIANRFFKIKGIIEKPSLAEAPSDLAIVGKYILTPEVFEYLRRARPNSKGEIILAEVMGKMLQDGKLIYGYEIEGKWLECGSKLEWLKSHLYLSLKDSRFGPELKKFLKEEKLI